LKKLTFLGGILQTKTKTIDARHEPQKIDSTGVKNF